MKDNNKFSRIVHLLAEYGYRLNEQNKTTDSEHLGRGAESVETRQDQKVSPRPIINGSYSPGINS